MSVARMFCAKTKQCTVDVLIPHERAVTWVFWHQQRLVGAATYHLKFVLKWPTPIETRRLRQISTYNVSPVKDNEKKFNHDVYSKLTTWDIVWVCTLPLSPPTGWLKKLFFVFCLNKIQFQWNKVCYKVSLCKNFQQQSCSITISPSNGPQILALNVIPQPKILTQSDPPS